MHVIATAGHVDHGKSTLVKGLTGMEPDRWAEERARGLTIDLGFAWTTLPSGAELAFVDVPGHVRFLKNMLAGVGAVDACLFVVAAPEGWKPQSEEHLRILELLGIDHGVVAITKVAGLDDEWRELVHLELADHVAGTFLDAAEVVEVDAPAGRGLAELIEALDRLVTITPRAIDRQRPRLWIDRVFSSRGSGTVVTGTLTGGTIAVGDELTAVGPLAGPGGTSVRVRSLQSHKQGHSSLGPGRRVAVNLTGVSRRELGRGDALVRLDQWAPTRTVDCSLTVLRSLDHDVGRRGAYQAYVGSGEHAVRLRVLGGPSVPAGGEGLVRLHLPAALPLLPGDRYVLRESGRAETVGGGEILDVAPVLPAARAAPSRSVARVVAERGWVEVGQLERLTGERLEPNVAGRWVVDLQARAKAEERLRAAVAGAGPLGLDLAALDERSRALATEIAGVTIEGGRARDTRARPPDRLLADHPYLAALDASPFTPPSPAGADVDPEQLRELVRLGLVVEENGCYFSKAAVEAAATEVARLLADHPEGVTVAEVRDALGTTRKFLLPLLSLLDARGVTRRRGDLRVGGPRLPAPG